MAFVYQPTGHLFENDVLIGEGQGFSKTLLPETTEQGLGDCLRQAQAALLFHQQGELVASQQSLENLLFSAVACLQQMQVDPQAALARAIAKKVSVSAVPRLLLYEDRAEIWVEGTYQGGWPLYSEADGQQAIAYAHAWGADVEYPTVKQLTLLQT